MIKNYFKVALRNLFKQKGLSLINILGLSIGLACFGLFLLYAINELTYDRQHANGDHVFRVYRWTQAFDGGEARGDAHLPMPLGPAMKENLPDVEEFVRFKTAWGSDFVRNNGQVGREEITFADPNVFKVFTFPMIYGSKENALDDLQAVVLTKSTALRLFGEENPTGKTLEVKLEDVFLPFTVNGVVEDMPDNSTIHFDVLVNYQFLASKTRIGERYQGNWHRSAFMTFVQLKPGSGLPHPGFNKENVVVINADGTETDQIWPRFQDALAKRSDVLGVTGTESSIGADQGYSRTSFEYSGQPKSIYEYFVDGQYLSVMDIPLVAGRNFDPTISGDSLTAVIFNEAAVKDFGWTNESAIGQALTGYSNDAERTPIVIGVVKDFNFSSLRDNIEPQLFHQFHDYQPYRFLVRIPAGNPNTVLVELEKEWSAIVPNFPFTYSFLDEDINRFYETEERWGTIVAWAGGIGIFLACLGLLGLAALAGINRTKEIGIRKVLGASLTGIVGLLSRDFIRLVAIALLIAAPLTWYLMQGWLEDFAYRINIHWSVFLFVGMGALGVAFLTVGFQSIRAGLANPVESLRSE